MSESGIVCDPRVLGGKPTIKGTRIPVYLILDYLADGYTIEEILREFPQLTRQDVKAALEFASSLVQQPAARQR